MTTNKELKILLMEEQMREDRERSLAIHQEKFGCSTSRLWDWTFSEPKSDSIFDNTLRPLPVNLYLDCKEYERGERLHRLGPEYVEGVNYLYLGAFGYHLLTKVIPFWLFIMLYF